MIGLISIIALVLVSLIWLKHSAKTDNVNEVVGTAIILIVLSVSVGLFAGITTTADIARAEAVKSCGAEYHQKTGKFYWIKCEEKEE